MRDVILNGKTQITHETVKGDDPQFLVFNNVSVDARLKVEVKKEIGSDKKLFNTINIPYLLEMQNKIEHYSTGRQLREIHLVTAMDDTNAPVIAVKTAKIDLAYGGEISLGQNDKVITLATDLKKIADSTLFTFEGTSVSNQVYEVKERTFKKDELQKKIDLATTDFLVFDVNSIPSKVEFRVNAQKITRTAESLLLDQEDTFNTVGYDHQGTPIYGTYKSVVIDVRACEEVLLEDETDPRADIKYHTVKTPY